MYHNTPERPIVVTCTKCKTTSDERDVTFVDIEEDMQGRDLLTFVCPSCGQTVTAYRRGG